MLILSRTVVYWQTCLCKWVRTTQTECFISALQYVSLHEFTPVLGPQNFSSCLPPSLTFRAISYLSSLFSLPAIQWVHWLERSQAAFLLPELKGTTWAIRILSLYLFWIKAPPWQTPLSCSARELLCSALVESRQAEHGIFLFKPSPGQMSAVL